MPGKHKKTGQGTRSFHRIERCMKTKKSSSYGNVLPVLNEQLELVEVWKIICIFVITNKYVGFTRVDPADIITKDLPSGWYVNYVADKELQYFQVVRQQLNTPMVVLRLFLINRDLSYQIYIAGHLVSPHCSVLSIMINALCTANICVGNFDDRFIEF